MTCCQQRLEAIWDRYHTTCNIGTFGRICSISNIRMRKTIITRTVTFHANMNITNYALCWYVCLANINATDKCCISMAYPLEYIIQLIIVPHTMYGKPNFMPVWPNYTAMSWTKIFLRMLCIIQPGPKRFYANCLIMVDSLPTFRLCTSVVSLLNMYY